MKGITIDRINIKDHQRYAEDQAALDTVYIRESGLVAAQSEMIASTSLTTSNWDELFEFHIKNIPWASFQPPPRYFFQKKRFFSYAILPALAIEKDKEEEGGEDTQQDPEARKHVADAFFYLLKKKLSEHRASTRKTRLTEQERTRLISLIDSIHFLNRLLLEINARKLQYQKG